MIRLLARAAYVSLRPSFLRKPFQIAGLAHGVAVFVRQMLTIAPESHISPNHDPTRALKRGKVNTGLSCYRSINRAEIRETDSAYQ